MKRLTLILALLISLPAAASAAGTGCFDTSGPLTLEKIRTNATGSEIFGCINRSFDRLSSSAAVTGSTNTTIFTGGIYTPLIGGISNGAWSGVKMSSYVFFASSASFEGGSVAFRYGITAATGAFSGSLTASSGTFRGGGGLGVTYGIAAGSMTFTGSYSPTAALDAATKGYVDNTTTSLEYKGPARLATTAALPTNVYANGSSGVGATLTGSSIGTLVVDGTTALVGDRVLVKDEVTAANNGIYTVTQNSALVVYILTRATDHDSPTEMPAAAAMFVTSGTANLDGGFVQVDSVTTVGTSGVSFVQFTGLGEVTAGTGLVKSGNTIGISPTLNLPYGISAATGTFSSGVTASSGTFLATGAAQYSLKTSSGINVGTGQILIGSGGYVQWPDGTKSTTSSSGGAGSAAVYISTSIGFASGTSNATTLAVAYATATVQFSGSYDVMCHAEICVEDDSSGFASNSGILVGTTGGAGSTYIKPFGHTAVMTANIGLRRQAIASAGTVGCALSYDVIIPKSYISAVATTNIAVTLATTVSGNTIKWPSTTPAITSTLPWLRCSEIP